MSNILGGILALLLLAGVMAPIVLLGLVLDETDLAESKKEKP